MSKIPTCVITGRIVGDSDACGDCDPCLLGQSSVPDVVKLLLAEKDDWRSKYSDAMDACDALSALIVATIIYDDSGVFPMEQR